MIFPKEKEFYELKQKHDVVPVVLKVNGDCITPISLFYNLDGEKKFLLESAERGKSWGRYSILGCNPYLSIKSYGDKVIVDENGKINERSGKVLDEVKKRIGSFKIATKNTIAPFSGGAVGYIGYDVVKQYEKINTSNEDKINLPESYLMFYKNILIYDHFSHLVYIICNVTPSCNQSYMELVKELLEMKEKILKNKKVNEIGEAREINIESNFDKEGFIEIVNKAKEYIAKGDAFQVVLSQRLTATTNTHPFNAYRKLRSINPSPYMFYIDFEDFQIVGSSPESLVKVEGDRVQTNPIAGTRKRGSTLEEDERLKEELLLDEKERAEHIMLVDLGRNDIGKVCKFGTTTVDKYMAVEMYSHVMHIVSSVSGQLMEGKDCFDALLACLPAGTVSGTPKVRAMEIIEELENVKRGIYAGAVGYFDYSGNMDMCIAIRTIVFKDGKAYMQAGGGIVYDSVPEKEYEESLNKAMVLKEVL